MISILDRYIGRSILVTSMLVMLVLLKTYHRHRFNEAIETRRVLLAPKHLLDTSLFPWSFTRIYMLHLETARRQYL